MLVAACSSWREDAREVASHPGCELVEAVHLLYHGRSDAEERAQVFRVSRWMRQLSLNEFYERSEAFDALVVKTEGIDRFCSSSSWILSAYETFSQEDASPWLFESEAGYVALYQSWHERIGRFAQPLEASWCLASPMIGTAPERLAMEFFSEVHARRSDWELLFLCGLMRDSAFYQALIAAFSSHYFVGTGPGVSRYRASLEGGYEGFLSRRSAKFRANLRRITRRAEEQGVTRQHHADPGALATDWPQLYARILAIESKSWKGELQSGISDAHMEEFYRRMFPRLIAQGALRVLFLQHEGEDIAFVFGAVFDGLYRGLQVSFVDSHREMSPGNLAQAFMIQSLCEEGVGVYDLGSELEYKALWAEQRVETLPLVIRPW